MKRESLRSSRHDAGRAGDGRSNFCKKKSQGSLKTPSMSRRKGHILIGKVTRQGAFALLRILFGLIWLANTWLQSNNAYINHLFLKSFDAGITRQPAWYFRGEGV